MDNRELDKPISIMQELQIESLREMEREGVISKEYADSVVNNLSLEGRTT